MTKMDRGGKPRRRPNTYDCETVRERSKQLVERLMDGLCGCCALPNPRGGVWCQECESHVRTTGKLCERPYEVAKGRPCPARRERRLAA